MSDSIPYADIVILALIAGFILLRLRSVLGDKTGNDNPGYFKPVSQLNERPEPIVKLDEQSLKSKLKDEPDTYLLKLDNSSLADTINAIKNKDPQFTATGFLLGARAAFEMVFDAYAKGDKQTIKMLTSDPIYAHFAQGLADRDAQEHKTETTLVSVQAKDITQASFTGSVAQLTVHFLSEQVSLVRDGKGAVVSGDASDIHHVEDHWTFERDVTSKNPNWKIIET